MIILIYLNNMKNFFLKFGQFLYKCFVYNTEPVLEEIKGAGGLTWIIYRHGKRHGYYLKESDKPILVEKARQLAIQAEANEKLKISKK